MKKTKQLFFLLCLFSSVFFQQDLNAQKTFKDYPAPELTFSDWINTETGEPLNLEGKHVFLEFWATWCGGCIKAIPHMNELHQKWASDSVLFISVNSHDSRAKVEQFLGKKEMFTPVALDKGQKIFNALSLKQIPATFLIDSKGKLRWKGYPGLINDEFMESYLEKDEIVMPEIKNPLLYEFSVSYAKDREVSNLSFIDGEKFGFSFKSRTITNIMGQLYSFMGKDKYEYTFEGKIPIEPALDLSFLADSTLNRNFVYGDVIDKLSKIFEFTIEEMEVEKDFWHLTIENEELFLAAAASESDQKKGYEEKDKIAYLNDNDLWTLAKTLNSQSDREILYEGDNLNLFDFTLPMSSDFSEVEKWINEKYGLVLQPQKKQFIMTTVRFY